MWIESEPDFALLEEVWGVKPKSTPPSPPIERMESKSKVSTLDTGKRTGLVPYSTRTSVPQPEPSRPPLSSIDETLEGVSVHIGNPELLDYLTIYKDEYRDRIVESILLRYVREKDETHVKKGSGHSGHSLQQRIKVMLSDSEGMDTLFLIVWFVVAMLLFFLVVRGPK